jgi:hypothetical protein
MTHGHFLLHLSRSLFAFMQSLNAVYFRLLKEPLGKRQTQNRKSSVFRLAF